MIEVKNDEERSGEHLLQSVSGGDECNHTLWECFKCGMQWLDEHDHEPPYYTNRRSLNAHRTPCEPKVGGEADHG